LGAETQADITAKDLGEEITSPLKEHVTAKAKEKGDIPPGASRSLFQNRKGPEQKTTRKRKPKTVPQGSIPDLNLPLCVATTLVPVGLVSSRVNQLAGGQEGEEEAKEEFLKKQKMCTTNNDARSVATVSGSPRRAQ
jgi:hypothetical protein